MGKRSLRQYPLQNCLAALPLFVALCLLPFKLAYAKDETMPQNLQSWDIEMGMHASHSFDLTQSVYSHYSENYEPLVMTMQDFKAVYKVLSGQTVESYLFNLAEPLIEPMHYNFEVDSNGGIRFDLRYHF